jgi:hypothetical protein
VGGERGYIVKQDAESAAVGCISPRRSTARRFAVSCGFDLPDAVFMPGCVRYSKHAISAGRSANVAASHVYMAAELPVPATVARRPSRRQPPHASKY